MAFHLIVTCVAQKKTKKVESILDEDIKEGDVTTVYKQWSNKLKSSELFKKKAEELYKGSLWNSYMNLWGLIRGNVRDANLWIISAGHGLISGNDKIVPYDITFAKSSFDNPSVFNKINSFNKKSKSPSKNILQEWWNLLNNGKSNTLKNLVLNSHQNDKFLIVLGKDYLDAISEELTEAIKKSNYRSNIIIVSNNPNDPTLKKLKDNWLYANEKFINLPNTQSSSINANIAKKIMIEMFDWGGLEYWSIVKFNDTMFRVSSQLPDVVKFDRKKMSDTEVVGFISDHLSKSEISKTKLHRALRDSGLACEQKRFNELYKFVLADLKSKTKRIKKLPKVIYSPRMSDFMFFLPENDDRVDPDFDFVNETSTQNRIPYDNDAYHYELYGHLNCDGLLVSKGVLEQSNQKKNLVLSKGGVHEYLRLPKNVPILGDCGAFSYIMEDIPPYKTEEIIKYYESLGFNYGVSIDHLIVPAVYTSKVHFIKNKNNWKKITKEQFENYKSDPKIKVFNSKKRAEQLGLFDDGPILLEEEFIDINERDRRYNITLKNGLEFIEQYKKGNYYFQPIGSVQGWDPKSYSQMAEKFIEAGYKYLALGGLVRSQTKEIISVMKEINKVRNADVKIHIFGVARTDAIKPFKDLNVNSIDNAGVLRQAWLSGDKNYYSPDLNHYSALRVPQSWGSKAKKIIGEGAITKEKLELQEDQLMKMLRKYDNKKSTLKETYRDLLAYNKLFKVPDTITRNYLRTLEDRPWKKCSCKLCKDVGIDMIIFRGNNRNRRRGFHNTWVFYNWLKN